MMNFDELPKERPNAFPVLPEGKYVALVKKAEMRKANTAGNLPYMVAALVCTNTNTGEAVTVFDNFYTSDKPLNKYKLRQFLTALGCMLKGNFEMTDLIKIIVNKKLLVAIKVEQNPGYSPRNIVDVFDDDIYYPVTEAAASLAQSTDTTDLPFNFDATDTAQPVDASEPGAESY